jgi:1-acyl-sn-glycerol-3-phosphate acyltransferase
LYARFAIKIYCRKIIINKPHYLQNTGPLLLACNHPNSFLDGIILTTLFEHGVYSLARGDAFKKSNKLLRKLHLLPVYRTSEGTENLEHNYTTFEACHDIFKQKGIVIIFSEGRCINEWHLRPLKKGTARLATSAWLKGIDLEVLPVGLNYNTFRNFGKNVFINFGEPLNKKEILRHQTDGKLFLSFNEQLQGQLENLVYEIDPSDKKEIKKQLFIPQPLWKKIVLAPFALLGYLIYAPFYFSIKAVTKLFFDNDHFDSVVVSLSVIIYPLYLFLLCWLCYYLGNWKIAFAAFLIFPFIGWSAVQLKNQLD